MAPLPVREGLNPSRVRTPSAITAGEFLAAVIGGQRHRHPEDNAQALAERFAAGEVVLADASPLSPDTLLAPGTDIWFYRMPAPEPPVPYEIEIVYEDRDLLIVNKPPFLATMPRGIHVTETALVRLRRATGNAELSPAHRLDRLTSGLLLLTKRREIRGAYQELFATRQVHKTYEAIAAWQREIVPGTLWRSRLVKTRGVLQTQVLPGKPNAETLVSAITPLNNTLARYTLHPYTGLTHQLRIHMSQAGAPILNDPLYPIILPPKKEDLTSPLQLRATTLEFLNPLTHKHCSYHL